MGCCRVNALATLPDDLDLSSIAHAVVARPVAAPTVTAEQAGAVTVREGGEPLVDVPISVPRAIIYDSLALPARDHLRVRAGVLGRLLSAQAALTDGWDLVVLDGWRSVSFQSALRAHYQDVDGEVSTGYVAAVDDPALRPGHTTGGAVDVTLSWHGVPLALGTDYDEFTPLAHPAAFEHDGADARVRDLRRLLNAVMSDAGFAAYPFEWWHWSWGEQWWAASTGAPEAAYDIASAPGAD